MSKQGSDNDKESGKAKLSWFRLVAVEDKIQNEGDRRDIISLARP